MTLGYRFELDDLTHLSVSTRLKLPITRASDGLRMGGDLARDVGIGRCRAGVLGGMALRFRF